MLKFTLPFLLRARWQTIRHRGKIHAAIQPQIHKENDALYRKTRRGYANDSLARPHNVVRPGKTKANGFYLVFFIPNFSLPRWMCSSGEYGMETVSALLCLVFRTQGKPLPALTFFCQVPIIYGCWKYPSVPAVRRRYGVREGNRQRR